MSDNKEENAPGTPESVSTTEPSAEHFKAGSSSNPEASQGAAEAWAGFIVLAVWGGIALVVVWTVVPGGKQFLFDHKFGVAILAGALIILVMVGPTRRWFKRVGSTAKAGIGIFGLVPLIFLALAMLFLLPVIYQIAIVRSVLVILLCLLPGSMYFLFIAQKKYSLVDEYLNHVKRLGLIDNVEEGACPPEAERRDVQFYINKFEAVLGKLPAEFAEKLRAGMRRDTPSPSATDSLQSTGLTELFSRETLLPVILTTLLIALCWIVTLPPWEGTVKLSLSEQPSQELGSPDVTEPQQHTALLDLNARPQLRNLYLSPYRAVNVVPILQGTDAQKESNQKQSGTSDKENEKEKKSPWYERWLGIVTPLPIPEFYAFIGAYFFAVQMLFRRYARRDLRPSAYVSVSIRIAIAIIGTWAAIQVTEAFPLPLLHSTDPKAQLSRLLVLGFVIGVFPRVAWQFITNASSALFGMVFPTFDTKLPISDIDGLTSWHEARLEEEDIENVPNMATADIVDLILNTRIPTDRIVDWMDQAILYTHIGPEDQKPADTRRKRLRAHGIYTASALVTRYEKSAADGTRTELELILGADRPSPVVSLVDSVQTNPNLQPIMKWRGLC